MIGYVNGKKYQRLSIVAAQTGKKILAPLQYQGTMDSALFEMWFEHQLIPELAANSTLVMDNAAFHRKQQLHYLAKNYGHKIIFLPPYTPELNPIENFWAWLKAKIRAVIDDFENLENAIRYCFS